MLGMSHFVDILGTGQLEDRNQISFLERTDENVTPEKIRTGDILNVRNSSMAQTHPNLDLSLFSDNAQPHFGKMMKKT